MNSPHPGIDPQLAKLSSPLSPPEKTTAHSAFKMHALGRGFGFAADDLVERSKKLVAHKKNGAQMAEAQLAAHHDTVSISSAHTTTLSTLTRTMQSAPQTSRAEEAIRAISRAAAPAAEPVRQMPSYAPPQSPLPQNVPRLNALAGCFVDSAVAVAAWFFANAIALRWESSYYRGLGWVFRHLGALQLMQSQAVLLDALQPILMAAAIVFFIQYFSILIAHGTVGRKMMGITLGERSRVSLFKVTLTGLSEVLTLGGALLLPLILLIPSRVALFPWIRFEYHSRDAD